MAEHVAEQWGMGGSALNWRPPTPGDGNDGCCMQCRLPPVRGGYGWVARARVRAHVLVLRAPSACVPLRPRACVL